MPFDSIHRFDRVFVHNKSDNAVLKAGYYNLLVVDEDEKSIALQFEVGNKWWFFRDTGEPYAGNAEIINVTVI